MPGRGDPPSRALGVIPIREPRVDTSGKSMARYDSIPHARVGSSEELPDSAAACQLLFAVSITFNAPVLAASPNTSYACSI